MSAWILDVRLAGSRIVDLDDDLPPRTLPAGDELLAEVQLLVGDDPVLIDATGHGLALVQALRNRGVKVHSFRPVVVR